MIPHSPGVSVLWYFLVSFTSYFSCQALKDWCSPSFCSDSALSIHSLCCQALRSFTAQAYADSQISTFLQSPSWSSSQSHHLLHPNVWNHFFTPSLELPSCCSQGDHLKCKCHQIFSWFSIALGINPNYLKWHTNPSWPCSYKMVQPHFFPLPSPFCSRWCLSCIYYCFRKKKILNVLINVA